VFKDRLDNDKPEILLMIPESLQKQDIEWPFLDKKPDDYLDGNGSK